jgi:hypothetical protein
MTHIGHDRHAGQPTVRHRSDVARSLRLEHCLQKRVHGCLGCLGRNGVVTEVGTMHNARVPIGELLFGVGVYEEPIGLLLDLTVARTLKFW